MLDTAAAMISLSDNTATDMLINLVGRPALEAALTQTGMADPALDRPFLTTREIFTLKLRQWPTLAERYLAADQAGRRALLASTVDRAPLPAVAAAGSWIAPRAVTSLEYFASASDLCRVYASLAAMARRPGLAPIGQVLSLNDDGLQLDPAQWKTTWFKGGSEPGVLTLTFMATTRTGHSYVVTVLAEDPSQPINQTTAIPVILWTVKEAFTLAARRLVRLSPDRRLTPAGVGVVSRLPGPRLPPRAGSQGRRGRPPARPCSRGAGRFDDGIADRADRGKVRGVKNEEGQLHHIAEAGTGRCRQRRRSSKTCCAWDGGISRAPSSLLAVEPGPNNQAARPGQKRPDRPVLHGPANGHRRSSDEAERRFTLRLSSRSVTDYHPGPPPGGCGGQAAAFPGRGGLPGGTCDVSGDYIGCVAVQAAAGAVIPHRRPRIRVRGGFLHIPQRDPGVQRGGDERVSERVGRDDFGDPGPAGSAPDDPSGAVPVQPPPVRGRITGPSVRSPMARSIARAVRGASGIVTTLPPLRVMVRVRCPRGSSAPSPWSVVTFRHSVSWHPATEPPQNRWRTTTTTATLPEAVRENEEVVPVNISRWVLPSGATVGR